MVNFAMNDVLCKQLYIHSISDNSISFHKSLQIDPLLTYCYHSDWTQYDNIHEYTCAFSWCL